MTIDLSTNPKQERFFNTAVEAAHGLNPYRNLYYGGAIRGGKTFVCLAVLAFLAKSFPGSRWHVFRADMPALLGTTVPSFQKIISGSDAWGWNRDRANFFAYHRPTDSRIFFKGENLVTDPELDNLLGLETNGILFEQLEELSEKLWQTARSRNGSWYLPQMPVPITLATFNPTQRWVKRAVYEPWAKGKLAAPDYFMQALPTDNPHITQEQWQAWESLAEQYRRQYINGDWTDFDNGHLRWAFAYKPEKHTGLPVLNPNETLYLSFDFNVNPMCCSVIQYIEGQVRVLETIKLPHSGTADMCDYILAHYPGLYYMVTGDATGRSRNASQADHMHNYQIIQHRLGLTMQQLKVPAANPPLEKNKVLVNCILENAEVAIHEHRARALHFDLGNVRIHPDGSIIKADRTKAAQQADALDTFRYWCNAFMGDFVRMG